MAKKDASTAGSPKGRSWLSTTILVALIALAAEPYLRSNEATNNSVHGFAVVDSKGTSSPLGDLISGKAALLVNVASACGLTPQYAGLESLYRKYKDQGFTIVGFPCNQFGAQEPGTMGEILDFCKSKFDVTFPVMAKIDVNGENEHPLYTFMKKEKPSVGGISKIEWNFAKVSSVLSCCVDFSRLRF